MRTKSKYKWALGIAVVLTCGLIAQGLLLWQTRQQLAELDPSVSAPSLFPTITLSSSADKSDDELSDIEKRLLARLDEKDQQRSLVDPWGGSMLASDPFAEFERMRQRMNQSINSLMGGFSPAGPAMSFGFGSSGFSSPEIELEETHDDYRLLIRVPEQHAISLQTEVEDREITISGRVSAQSGDSGRGYSSQFVSSSQFTRRFDLPGDVDDIKMYTEQTDEGMMIVLPKATKAIAS